MKLNDHAVDALRYAVATSRPLWQAHIPQIDAAKRLPDERSRWRVSLPEANTAWPPPELAAVTAASPNPTSGGRAIPTS
ncbi:hypothetical protein GS921_00010 [Rhodococcus hoagii]|nr:hypothetical protein [Prescottella equi]